MRDYLKLFENNIQERQTLENHVKENRKKINLRRIIQEVKSDYHFSISHYVDIMKVIQNLGIVHYTKPDLLIKYINNNKITKEPLSELNSDEFDEDNYINCFLGNNLWLFGLCEIKFKKEIIHANHLLLSKHHSLFENKNSLQDYLMDSADLDYFLKEYYLTIQNGAEVLSKDNNVFERPALYLTNDIDLDQVESITCSSKRVYDYVLNSITNGKEEIKEKLKYAQQSEELKLKKYSVIATENNQEVRFCIHYKDGVYLISKKYQDCIFIGTFNEIKFLLKNLVDSCMYDWADFEMPNQAKIIYDIDDLLWIDEKRIDIFSKKYQPQKNISDQALKLFFDFIYKCNVDNQNMTTGLRFRYNSGMFKKDVEDIIKDDSMYDDLVPIDYEIIIGVKLENEKFIKEYVEKHLNSEDIDKYMDINYFYRRLFFLERSGYINLNEVRRK